MPKTRSGLETEGAQFEPVAGPRLDMRVDRVNVCICVCEKVKENKGINEVSCTLAVDEEASF
ncbi:hypothetical protein ZHAS_00000911 [Anopheles sinensis]|uniref:Uncharacterized protein n=1 Tax=Anopheles sinensis TaxID=74873 RepID=A0A084VAS7_ANOSI|nr:hypothetical protein ZHAS_00000911 [Anopheles sinensis]